MVILVKMYKLMKQKFLIICLVILTIGIIFRLALTENGNFLFNMDSARDFVDVREMVELRKLRLTGPSTPIDGLYDGPFWYYFLAVGYIISGGNPYSAVLMQIFLWAIGGFFLLKLIKNFGIFFTIPIGFTWVASNYIVLANLYSFNPTPVTLLAPMFVYLLVKYLKSGNAIYGILTWILGGLFFNLEMNFGVFVPLIILSSIILTGNLKLLKQKYFYLGIACFILALLPQILFDLKHQFIMSKAVLRHLADNSGSALNILDRVKTVSLSFYNTFLPTMMNSKYLAWIILGFLVPILIKFMKSAKKDLVVYVSFIFIIIPFLGYLILPVTVNPWHLGGEMAVSLILIAFLFKSLFEGNFPSKIISVTLSIGMIWFAVSNISNFFMDDRGKANLDPSLYKNEITAIDYVYKHANGKNFKVYTYLPSIYDYPYQYLFWWYGNKKYGYLPADYAYIPDKPSYISNKASFSATESSLDKRPNSNLVFLIKEPDRNYTRSGWEGNFIKLKTIKKEMVGSLEIEIKQL